MIFKFAFALCSFRYYDPFKSLDFNQVNAIRLRPSLTHKITLAYRIIVLESRFEFSVCLVHSTYKYIHTYFNSVLGLHSGAMMIIDSRTGNAEIMLLVSQVTKIRTLVQRHPILHSVMHIPVYNSHRVQLTKGRDYPFRGSRLLSTLGLTQGLGRNRSCYSSIYRCIGTLIKIGVRPPAHVQTVPKLSSTWTIAASQ
ncbi:hypothetical protein C8R43DRAFT_1127564 [Mycena crocata]|nr:hypothetical protein C8R43DRAFT_1127564 [Mycena crocata]